VLLHLNSPLVGISLAPVGGHPLKERPLSVEPKAPPAKVQVKDQGIPVRGVGDAGRDGETGKINPR